MSQTNHPSIKRIMQTGCSKETAARIKAAFTADRDELNEHEAGAARTAECYNRPNLTDLRLTVIDSLLEAFGVESAGDIEYCNTGDTYAATICYCQGRFIVGSWGDIVERYNL